MGENADVFDSFESALKQRSTLGPSTLYRNTNISNKSNNQQTNAQSIISHVANQIKAIQSSEVVRSVIRPTTDMNKYKNSSFLPLNELQDRVPPRPPEQQKFDTQHFSNTQLINIVEDAEALDVNVGMTQEFETTFLFGQEESVMHHKQSPERKNLNFPILDISLKEPDQNHVLPTSSENHKEHKLDNNSINLNEDLELDAKPDTLIDVDTSIAVDKLEDTNDIDDLDAVEKDLEQLDSLEACVSQQNFTQKAPSPVFYVKSKKPISDPEPPLVVDLDTFENFEIIAMPIVQIIPDLEEAKFLINSQIVGNELEIHTYMDDTEPLSPIIDISDNLFKIDKKSVTKTFIKWSCKDQKVNEERNISDTQRSESKESIQNDKSIYQDEILFSSDEEEAYHQRSYKDLPFTCALETSFYEQNEVLDKTMYVGFQTASNKSIQIGTESFCKAKSFLDSVEHDINDGGTLTELVEICDMKNSGTGDVNALENIGRIIPVDDNIALDIKNKTNILTSSVAIPNNDNNSVKNKILEENNVLLDNIVTTTQSKFEGFKTASNKPIQLSEESLSRSKMILQSIILDSSMSKNEGLEEGVVKQDDNMKEVKSIDDDDLANEFQEDLLHAELEEIMNDAERDKDRIVQNNKTFDVKQNIGFKTASNKNIKISEAAIAKGEKILKDIDMNKIASVIHSFDSDIKNEICNIGFRTASNKDIIISETASIQTKKFFDNIDLNDDVIDLNIEKVKNTDYKSLTSKSSLQNEEVYKIESSNSKLAGNQQVNSKNIFIPPDSVNVKDDDRQSPFLGFDNNEKYAKMVKETLEKSQKILEKLTQSGKVHANDSDLPNTQMVQMSNQVSDLSKDPNEALKVLHKKYKCSPGFRTASNKEVKISEVALAKSKKIFQDIDENQCITMLQKSIKTTHSDLGFKGFQTASNKDIKISETALAKSKQIFQDINDSKYAHLNGEDVNQNTRFIGFQTASHKEVKISEEALAKSKKIFQDINDVISADTHETVNTETIFKGFQTASNKQISISEKALVRSRNLFREICEDNIFEKASVLDSTSAKENVEEELFKGFQTASNKKVIISEKALVRSKKIFEDIAGIDSVRTVSNHLNTKAGTDATSFKGFQTANNKEVSVSQAALDKSRQIFQDMPGNNLVTTNSTCAKTVTNSNFQGFKTASNREVQISAEALVKSKKLFEDINDDVHEELNPAVNTIIKDKCIKFKGFQTAHNKEVKISAEALAKSKKLFEDINDDVHEELNPADPSVNIINKDRCIKFKGFQTARNKEVKISAEALEKCKKIFLEVNEPQQVDAHKIDLDDRLNYTFKGFQTASNKEVIVSKEAMAKSKKLFHDIDNVDFGSDNNRTDLKSENLGFVGFHTASNKNVNISEEAIAKSKKLFKELDTDHISEDFKSKIPEVKCYSTTSGFVGFQTASNKNVKVSEEAIAKSKKIFQELDSDPITEAFKSNIPEVECYSKLKDPGYNTTSYKRKDVLFKNNFTKPDNLLTENIEADMKMQPGGKHHINKKCTENAIDVDTQLLKHFEESMHEVTPKKSKRSGSPILSYPKVKKRKIFKIPYSQKSPKKTSDTFKPPDTVQKSENMYSFSVSYKKVKMLHLKDLQGIEDATADHTNVDPYIQKFYFENLLEFEFTNARNDVTNPVLTIPEVKKIFLNSVNKKLVPEGWLEIQLKLILWKLISYEMKFPKAMQFTCTAKNLLEQLKYRYDKELYNAERPALRKIFERDDSAAKTLVLCIVAVCDVQDASQPPELLLTDGWYIIKAVIDKMLAKYVGNGKISVGTKLVTNGAELVGSEQAVSPWEDTSSIRLKIFGNSTRRARWDTRLGYHGNAAILSQLSTVSMDGGKVSKLRVFVTRVYPPLYVDKFEDGSTVTRSERLEHLHQMKFETERQALMEKIYEDVEKEVMNQQLEDSEDVIPSGGKRKCLDSGSQIAKIMKRSRDPNEFRSHLTSTQTALLEDHTTKEREKLLQEIQTRVQTKMAALGVTLTRNVVTLFKVRIAGIDQRRGGVEVTRALLSIWRPNEAVIELIKEGTWIEILNVVPTALRYSELHVSAGRQSIFSQSKHKENEKVKPFTDSLKRTCYPIKDLAKNPAMTTDYNEIDTVGMIFEIDPAINNFDLNKHQFQNVFLTDADKNIISVNFWGGLKKFGFENVLDTGQIVAGTNLQKRAGNSRKNIPQYRVTEFSYFTKTPKSETARRIIEEMEHKLLNINKKAFQKECVSLKNNYFAKQKTNENVTPYRFPNMDVNLYKNKIFIDSPIPHISNKKDDNLNLSGLDFDSTFKETNAQDLSPKTLLRKRQVQERIAKLRRYGEPPPLSPMQIINKSKNAANAYKSPLISKSDVSPCVAISEKNLPNDEKCVLSEDVAIQCSPVINLNRTYVKRSNPVRLNFSKNENSVSEVVDEFAEEFEYSPPLSLD